MSGVIELTPVEQRILGCLLEKHRTTPDQYPLTLNALRLACNQATNRDPVVEWDEATLRPALERLGRERIVRFASGHGSRVAKYRHLADEALGIGHDEQAVLAVLLLRGPQTPGELKTRTERLHPFADLGAVHATLGELARRGLVRDAGRRPGQKEDRWEHLLGGGEEPGPGAPASLAEAGEPRALAGPPQPDGEPRVAALEARVAALEAQLAELLEQRPTGD